jgi:hypothetical protein
MVGAQGSLVLKELQQVGHLLQVGRHIWVVAPQVHIVELNVDDVLDLATSRIEFAGVLSRSQYRAASSKNGHLETD